MFTLSGRYLYNRIRMMNRRNFITAAATGVAAASLPNGLLGQPVTVPVNGLPRWRGFNIQEFYRPPQYHTTPERRAALDRDFQWMADWGFNFVRFPMSYPCYLEYDASKGIPITPEEDRKSTRLNSSHVKISYAVFCL